MIIVKIWEGLGNQLFQYAFARNLQMQGKEVYLDSDFSAKASVLQHKREYRLNNLNISIQEASNVQKQKFHYLQNENVEDKIIDILEKIGIWKYRRIEQKTPFDYNTKYFCTFKNCYVKGWFQNPKYFVGMRDVLLKDISPKYKIKIKSSLKQLIECDQVVAVHIRRGDYVRCHVCMNMCYYRDAMKYIYNHIKQPFFLFFSDDMKWVHNYFGNNNNFFYIDDFGKFADFEELFIMSRCKNIIIANSTFSWWAAWLNRKENRIVIAPKKWNKSISVEETNQLIPSEWIRI